MSITRFFRASALPATVPGQVAGVTPTVASTQVALSWQAPAANGSPISSYTVRYRTAGAGSFAVFGTTGNLALTVSGLTNGVDYQFTVEATNGVGVGPASSPITARPLTPAVNQLATPTGFVAGGVGPTSVAGSWNAVANASAYIVERSTAVDYSANLTSVYVGNARSFTDATAALTTLYYYRVKATGSGYSDSNYATVSVDTSVYTAPTGQPTITANSSTPS